ncbi:MAG: hypothetical protein D6706_14605 [Chloroflexi bacterium]|nr:MAG: hypothetical protein D6706_14605 [Chloroflexota bacterium]
MPCVLALSEAGVAVFCPGKTAEDTCVPCVAVWSQKNKNFCLKIFKEVMLSEKQCEQKGNVVR